MGSSWTQALLNATSWPVVALLFVAYLLCTAGFDKRNQALGGERPTLDARGWYSAGEAHRVLDRQGERGRRLYAWTEVSLDLVFPLVYGGLFAAFLARLWEPPWARWIVFVPLIAVALDLLENLTIAYLAWTFDPERVSPLGGAAGLLTAAKSGALLLSLALVVIGAVHRLAVHSAGDGPTGASP